MSSRTTSHGWLVVASQPRNRAAAVSASPAGADPVVSANAWAYPVRTDARPVAVTHTSRSTSRARQTDSARYTASWVLPVPPGQSYSCRLTSGPVSATRRPGAIASARAGPVSGRALKQSASGGTAPDRIAEVRRRSSGPTDFAARSWLSTGAPPVLLYACAPQPSQDPVFCRHHNTVIHTSTMTIDAQWPRMVLR